MRNILQAINALYPLSDTPGERLTTHLRPVHFPKKHLPIEKDVYGKWAYFIEQGMTRSFRLGNGEEITTSFSWEGGVVFSMDEPYHNKISEDFVETVEEVEAYKIALTDQNRLFQTNIERTNRGRIIHQNEYRHLYDGLHFTSFRPSPSAAIALARYDGFHRIVAPLTQRTSHTTGRRTV